MSAAIWLIHDGKVGLRNQAMGVAEAIGLDIEDKTLAVRLPWRALPPALWWRALDAAGPGGARLEPPWPVVAISAGGRGAAPALAVRKAAQGRCLAVQIQTPGIRPAAFDLMIVPDHDRTRGPNVMVTQGAVHRVSPAKLAEAAIRWTPALAALPRPRVAVLLGGANGSYAFDPGRIDTLVRDLSALADAGAGLMITASRRTPADLVARLKTALADRPAQIWDGVGENPYFGYLALADHVIATADSVSMVTEATATGKPVHVFELPGGAAKFRRFHASMAEAGITRPWAGQLDEWRYAIPDDTARAGARIRAMLVERGLI